MHDAFDVDRRVIAAAGALAGLLGAIGCLLPWARLTAPFGGDTTYAGTSMPDANASGVAMAMVLTSACWLWALASRNAGTYRMAAWVSVVAGLLALSLTGAAGSSLDEWMKTKEVRRFAPRFGEGLYLSFAGGLGLVVAAGVLLNMRGVQPAEVSGPALPPPPPF